MPSTNDSPHLLSSQEWLEDPEFRGTVVMDPDGWDRSGSEAFERSWGEAISRTEFRHRLALSSSIRRNVTGPVVITHDEMGIYLGSALGFGFWSLLDAAGQDCAVTFPDIATARSVVAGWADNNDPDSYGYVPVPDGGEYATVDQLTAAGLAHLLGEMSGGD